MAPPSMKTHVKELYNKFWEPIHLILYVLLMFMIVYVSHVPKVYRKYSNNLFVRLLLFGLILIINDYISYSHALLFAIFVVLFISFSPGFIEKFDNPRLVARKEQRWLDESILGENPAIIQTDRASTQAIQG